MAADHVTRLALVGYGRIAPKHLEAFRALGAEFVAACNRSAEGRHKAEHEGGIPRTYAAIHEMLDRERPDGVVCCASMPNVYGAAIELLNHGVPTLLEKPPGTSLDEFRHLCELAQQKRAAVMIGLNRRHYSVVRKALDDCGGPDAVTAAFVEWSEDPRYLLARGFSREEVSRMVFGNTLHGLDLLVHLAGPIDEPAVVGHDLGDPLRWMMALQGVSRRGALASFHSTWDSPGRWRLSFCSPGRRYVFAPLETCQVSETGVKDVRPIEPDEVDTRFKPGFFAQAQAFLRAVATGEVPPQYNLDSAGPAMRLADALTGACLGAVWEATKS
jgi:predicted dehydrogenase